MHELKELRKEKKMDHSAVDEDIEGNSLFWQFLAQLQNK